MRFTNRITGIEGVVSGGVATFSIPTGPRYHKIALKCYLAGVATVATSVIDRIRVKVNEITIWDVSVARLLKEADLHQMTYDSGDLGLYFSEPWRADKVDEQLTAWDTFGERSFKVELVMKSGLVGTPLIIGQTEFDYGATLTPDANGNLVRRKSIIKKLEYTFNAPNGAFDIDTLNIRNPILRLLMDAASPITQVEVTADNVRVREDSLAQNEAILNDYGFDPSAFAFPLVFDFTEQLTDFLEVSKSLNVRVTSSAAQSVTILQETVAPGFM